MVPRGSLSPLRGVFPAHLSAYLHSRVFLTRPQQQLYVRVRGGTAAQGTVRGPGGLPVRTLLQVAEPSRHPVRWPVPSAVTDTRWSSC